MVASVSTVTPPSRKANKALVAEFFGVAVPSVDAWVRRGCPYVQRGERGRPWIFDLLQVAEWRFGGPNLGDSDKNPEDMAPKERRDWYEGEKVRIELEIGKSNLITLDQYREEMARILKRIAHVLEMLPDILERKCALPPTAVATLQAELDKERDQLVSALEATDECAA
ncbi:MAG: DUF1441 family protein [Gammaproteobacteria bacterium]|nr:DUF1441 family protein [Gammaproteobacteria bacterium]